MWVLTLAFNGPLTLLRKVMRELAFPLVVLFEELFPIIMIRMKKN